MNTTTARTAAQFVAETIGESPYHVWVGVAGYDTRPYVKAGTVTGFDRHTALPVAYWGGNACNHIADEGDVESENVLGFVEALPVGAVIVVPDYYGCNYEGEESYILAPNGWLNHDSYSVHDEEVAA